MNVLHISPTLYDRQGRLLGGGERYAIELAKAMSRTVPTRLVSFGEESSNATMGDLEVVILGRPWYIRGNRGNPLHRGLLSHLRWANVVHCHQKHVLNSSLSAMYCRIAGKRVFVTDHGGGGHDLSNFVSTNGWYHGRLYQSQFAKSVANDINSRSSTMISGGVDIELFSPDPLVVKQPLVVFVGRMLPHKGINYLIQSLPEGVDLLIFGRPGPERYMQDLKNLAQGHNVQFRPDCDDATIVESLRRAMAVVLPSVHQTMYQETTAVPELLGQSLLEGMACGTAAIGTNIASLPEIIHSESVGFLVAPNSETELHSRIVWLRDHPKQAASMGLEARRRIELEFTWPGVVQRCLQAYQLGAK